MSRIYFHSETDDAEVSGRERAHMCCLTNDIAMANLHHLYDSPENPCWLRKFIPQDSWALTSSMNFDQTMHLYLTQGGNYVINGETFDAWTATLNTVMAIGNDQLKLFARLHAQCEIHCWVDGGDRKWLAGIIQKGVDIGLYRQDMGWESVVALLLSKDCEPVVCSYSVCDQFPSRHVAEWVDANDGDDWYKLKPEKRWAMAMAKLRENSGGLQLKPSNWDEYRFGHLKTIFDITSEGAEG